MHRPDGPSGLLESLSDRYIAPSLLAWRALELAAYVPVPEEACIDLGSGTGLFSHSVARDALGVDLDFRQLSNGITRGWLSRAICADLRALPLRDGSVREAVANCAFEHIPHVERVLSEAARVVGSGGRLQLTVPVPGLDRAYIINAPWYARLRNSQLAHVNLWPLDQWIELLRIAGFETLRVTTVVTRGQARRWDLLDAPLFIGWRSLTWFNAYSWLVMGRPQLPEWHRRVSIRLARWIVRGGHPKDEAVCVYIESERL